MGRTLKHLADQRKLLPAGVAWEDLPVHVLSSITVIVDFGSKNVEQVLRLVARQRVR